MKTLLVMRHAKSAWDDPAVADHDRPLAPRGRKAAPRIAAWLREQGYAPAHVRCSSSTRTRETLELLRPALAGAEIQIDAALYLATVDELLAQVRELPDVPSAMFIGHNPGVQRLVVTLAGRSRARRRVEAKFPTAAVAVLALPSWADTQPAAAELVAYVTPRELV